MNGDDREEAVEAPCCVTLEAAVAPVLDVTLSFVAWASAVVGGLQRSRNTVHLQSGAPIVGIAWSHSLTRLEFLRVGCSSVDAGHGHRNVCRGAGRFSAVRTVFVQRHVAEQWLIQPASLFKRRLVRTKRCCQDVVI